MVLQLAQLLKFGKYTGDIGVPKSLVLVGHSFGSSISAAAVVAQPDVCDGLILTAESTMLEDRAQITHKCNVYRLQLQRPRHKRSGVHSSSTTSYRGNPIRPEMGPPRQWLSHAGGHLFKRQHVGDES